MKARELFGWYHLNRERDRRLKEKRHAQSVSRDKAVRVRYIETFYYITHLKYIKIVHVEDPYGSR